MKKQVYRTLGLLIIFSFITIMPFSNRVEAKDTKKAALKAYSKFLKQSTIKWENSYVSLKDSNFGITYVNNDNVPELIINNNNNFHYQGYFDLYTYKKGKIVHIGPMMDGISVYPKKNVIEVIHSGTGGYEHYYFTLSGIKVKHYLHKVEEESLGGDINGDGKVDYVYSKYTSSDSWETKEISKKKFNQLLKKMVGSTKLKSIKFYKKTKKKRKKVLGY